MLLILPALPACSAGDTTTDRFVVTDSAGIAIASNTVAVDSVPEWTLPETPDVEIRSVEEDESTHLLNVSGATRLSDGRIVIVNGGRNELRFYSPSGMLVRTFGRKGDGPGEFRYTGGIWRLPDDTVAVWDGGTRRLTVLAPDGSLVRSTLLAGGAANPEAINVLDNGSFLLQDELFDIPKTGFKEATLTISRHTVDGSIVAKVGSYPHARVGLYPEIRMMGAPLFEPRTSATGSRDGYWIGTGRSYEAAAYDTTGRLTRIVRWLGPTREITTEDVEASQRQRLVSATPESRERYELMFRVQPVAPQFPAYNRVIGNRDGQLLVETFVRPGMTTTQWLLFDSDGRLAGRITPPPAFRIFEFSTTHVLGVHEDEDEVESIRLYTLTR